MIIMKVAQSDKFHCWLLFLSADLYDLSYTLKVLLHQYNTHFLLFWNIIADK